MRLGERRDRLGPARHTSEVTDERHTRSMAEHTSGRTAALGGADGDGREFRLVAADAYGSLDSVSMASFASFDAGMSMRASVGANSRSVLLGIRRRATAAAVRTPLSAWCR